MRFLSLLAILVTGCSETKERVIVETKEGITFKYKEITHPPAPSDKTVTIMYKGKYVDTIKPRQYPWRKDEEIRVKNEEVKYPTVIFIPKSYTKEEFERISKSIEENIERINAELTVNKVGLDYGEDVKITTIRHVNFNEYTKTYGAITISPTGEVYFNTCCVGKVIKIENKYKVGLNKDNLGNQVCGTRESIKNYANIRGITEFEFVNIEDVQEEKTLE